MNRPSIVLLLASVLLVVGSLVGCVRTSPAPMPTPTPTPTPRPDPTLEITGNTYVIGAIQFTLPEEYTLSYQKRDEIYSQIPESPPTIEYFLTFENSYGNIFYIFYWFGFPYRDYGPMSAKESWPITVAGYDTKLIRTDHFMGREKEVLVTHCKFSGSERMMVYTPNINRTEFTGLLQKIIMK